MVVGESVARSSRSLKRGYGGEAKGICTAPTRGRCEPLRCPLSTGEKEGTKCETTWQRGCVMAYYGHDRTDQNIYIICLR